MNLERLKINSEDPEIKKRLLQAVWRLPEHTFSGTTNLEAEVTTSGFPFDYITLKLLSSSALLNVPSKAKKVSYNKSDNTLGFSFAGFEYLFVLS
jgi:hypothetical protein